MARIWSEEDGPEAANLEGLAGPDLSAAEVIAPTEVELRAWLEREIPRSEAHLRSVLDGYWEAPWRRAHKAGGGVYPEDHLWRAAWAVQSMRDALVELA